MPSNPFFAPSVPAPNSSTSRCFAAASQNGTVRSMPKSAAERLERLAHQLAIAARPRRDRAVGERLRLVGHDAQRIEVDASRRAPGSRAGAVRRVERERPRRHLRHAQPAVDAGQPAREQPIAAVERVDDDDVVGEVEGDVDRLGQPPLDAAADDQRDRPRRRWCGCAGDRA